MKKMTHEEEKEYTQWIIKRIRKNPLERRPTTARDIQKFREETKKKHKET